MEPGHNTNLSLAWNFYSPNYPNFMYLYETKPDCNRKIFSLLWFCYRQVPQYNKAIHSLQVSGMAES